MIRLHRSGQELKKQCFVRPIASLTVCTQIKPLTNSKKVDRSSREEVTHTHLDPEGLCAPRKAEKTSLHLRKAARKLHCPAQPKSSQRAALPVKNTIEMLAWQINGEDKNAYGKIVQNTVKRVTVS